MRPLLTGLSLLLLCGLLSAGDPPTPTDVRRAMDEVYDDNGYQGVHPGHDRPPRTDPQRPNRQPRRTGTRTRSSSRGGSADLAEILIWCLVGVATLLVVAWAIREWIWKARRKDVDLPASVPTAPAPERKEPVPRRPHDALAGEGRFAEAIHQLLLSGIQEIRGRSGGKLSDSWTSREILHLVKLPDGAREALQRLVVAVERTHFGGRPIAREDYDRCVEGYQAFRAAFVGAKA